ncbi:hypothetical protein HPB49_004867 [Dermacentor silvarum]|uniref:Uncharacterized protein n=1 Tax=Dermacentor silvarum TaxID=543639 RepID=A0ACB8CV97_DERSI|nr:hypothetical protein HPB49_004867 [Dermacentor silvarum]
MKLLQEQAGHTCDASFAGVGPTVQFTDTVHRWLVLMDVSNCTQHIHQKNADCKQFESAGGERLIWLETSFLDYLADLKNGKRLFRIPFAKRDAAQRKVWLQRISPADFNPTLWSRLCEGFLYLGVIPSVYQKGYVVRIKTEVETGDTVKYPGKQGYGTLNRKGDKTNPCGVPYFLTYGFGFEVAKMEFCRSVDQSELVMDEEEAEQAAAPATADKSGTDQGADKEVRVSVPQTPAVTMSSVGEHQETASTNAVGVGPVLQDEGPTGESSDATSVSQTQQAASIKPAVDESALGNMDAETTPAKRRHDDVSAVSQEQRLRQVEASLEANGVKKKPRSAVRTRASFLARGGKEVNS